jgi:hypothetical protein
MASHREASYLVRACLLILQASHEVKSILMVFSGMLENLLNIDVVGGNSMYVKFFWIQEHNLTT